MAQGGRLLLGGSLPSLKFEAQEARSRKNEERQKDSYPGTGLSRAEELD